MIIHLINGQSIDLGEAVSIDYNGPLIEFYDEEDDIVAIVNVNQVVWINTVDVEN